MRRQVFAPRRTMRAASPYHLLGKAGHGGYCGKRELPSTPSFFSLFEAKVGRFASAVYSRSPSSGAWSFSWACSPCSATCGSWSAWVGFSPGEKRPRLRAGPKVKELEAKRREKSTRPGRRRSHGQARERNKRKSPPDLFRRALIVLLSTRDRSARIIENGSCKPALKPVARGEILNSVPSRPVHVMATAIVRVHRDCRNSRFRVGANNSRSMMLSVSLILTISLGERRRTEQSDSRHRY